MSYRDWKNVMDTAVGEALDEKTLEIAKELKLNGVDFEIIAKSTGLDSETIKGL